MFVIIIARKSLNDFKSRTSNNGEQKLSRVDLLSQLADPLTLRGNQGRYPHGTHSLMLIDQQSNSEPRRRHLSSSIHLNASHEGLETTTTKDNGWQNRRFSNCFSPLSVGVVTTASPNPSLNKTTLEAFKSSFGKYILL